MRKTKVAFFSDLLIEGFDGAQRTMFHMINRIPKDKYEYCFICGEGPGDKFDFEVLGIPKITIPFNNNYSMAMPALAYFKMKNALDKFRPDVIHIASPSLLGRFALDYANGREIPVVTIYHTHYISYVDYYLKGLPLVSDLAKSSVVSGQRSFYNKCSLILVPTEEIKRELSEFGFEDQKMRIWGRGIDHCIFNPQKKDRRFINKLTGNNHFNILFASRLVWEKNLKTLIRLYGLFESKKMEANFIIAGEGNARDELQKMMPKASFLGKLDQDQLSVLYASSDVFVFPSVSETFGSVVVEAMASGCPCVIAKGGGSQSYIDHGVNGFLCNPDEESEYFEKILLLLNHDVIREEIIKEGLKYAKNLDWNILVEEYLSLIDHYALKVSFL